MSLDFEVDFLPVGDGAKSGDAIACRFGNLAGPREQQFVIVIDGGTKDSGERQVEFIRNTYGTNKVDLVVSTHPDNDHASGLTVVLEELDVDTLWMHRPWLHSADIQHMFVHGRITDRSLKQTLRESLEHANELEEIAKRKGITIEEPFSGETGLHWQSQRIHLRVLGPSRAFYDSLLPHFRDCPEPKTASYGAVSVLTAAYAAVKEVVTKVLESWGWETLTDPAENEGTSAENNTSVILLLEVGDDRILFTADAGVPAIDEAADCAAGLGIDLQTANKIQIPHHGSRRNVGPTILNRILGPKLPSQADPRVDRKTAVASVSADGAPKHPAKKVLNAFKRRGAKCISTAGSAILLHSIGAPQRANYGPADTHPFYPEVEE